MTRPLNPARRIILRSLAPCPPPLPPEALIGYANIVPSVDQDVADDEDAVERDSVVPDSFIRDLRAVVGDPIIPADAKLPDLDSWLDHEIPAAEEAQGFQLDFAALAAELEQLTSYLRKLYSASTTRIERHLHPALDINTLLEDLPVLAPPQISLLRWLWLALLCG